MELIILLDDNALLEKLLDIISSLVEDHSLSLVCTFDVPILVRELFPAHVESDLSGHSADPN